MNQLGLRTFITSAVSGFKQKQINSFDITLLLRQFAALIASGIPITQCCELLEKAQAKTALRLLIYSIKREIMSGKTLSASMQRHQDCFDDFTCQLIRVGEHSGKLDEILAQIAAHYENKLRLKKQIQQALVYPAIIILTAVLVTCSMLLIVIPRFNALFQDVSTDLPLLTRWIFYLSSQLQQYGKALLLCVIILFIFFYHKEKNIRHLFFEKYAMKTPILKHCLHKITLVNFARNLALTIAAGIPITEGLKLAEQTFRHLEFAHVVIKLHHKISAGLQLHHAMSAFPFFPTLMVQMTKIGEESAMLPQMLNKTAEFLQSDIDHLISHFSKLLEPLIMLVLGVLIGGLVIGMYLPIFKLGSAF